MKKIWLVVLCFLLLNGPLSAQSRKRIAIIGGGASGVGAAMFLSKSSFDVDVYEARDKFGGNARSVRVRPPHRGYEVTVDFGPLVFPNQWELYLQVLKHFGIYKNDFNYFNASIAVWKEGSYDRPSFVTPDISPSYLEYVATNEKAITDLIKVLTTLQSAYIDFKNKRVPADLSIGDWFKTVSTNPKLIQEVILPIFTSFHTAPVNKISEFSILPIMKTTTFRSPLSFEPLFTSKSGLGTYLNLIINEVIKAHRNIRPHLATAVVDIRRTSDGKWAVLTDKNPTPENFDYIIMANQPINAKEILKGDEFISLNKILNQLNYHKTKVVLHTDQYFALKNH
ncbi:MAG: FAD-dependent oxidoreductase, partial [Bacteriovoracales bacterium]